MSLYRQGCGDAARQTATERKGRNIHTILEYSHYFLTGSHEGQGFVGHQLWGILGRFLKAIRCMDKVNQKNRPPSQSRGVERYDSILDAYSTLICERGDVHVSIQAIAQAAGASVGSMYHFFVGREALLDALAQRHIDRIANILQELEGINDTDWKIKNPNELIEKLIAPTLGYLSCNRDVYIIAKVLSNRPEFSRDGIPAQMLRLYGKVLKIRNPHFSQEQIALYSKVLFKLPSGLIEIFSEQPDTLLLEQAKIACSAYIAAISY